MRRLAPLLLSSTLVSMIAPGLEARPLERVPQDGTLDQAIQRVDHRGVVEIAEGVYPAPPGGFEIRNPGKSFTIRAAEGATVVLDGQGVDTILHYTGDGLGTGRRVAFERLVFRNGSSNSVNFGGAVTVINGDAAFVSSLFEGNVSLDLTTRGGGAIQVRDDSTVRVTNCVFVDNSARLRGGAIYVIDSKLDVAWSQFIDNRNNLPGHSPDSAGGAIFALDFEAPANTEVTINNSRFDGNEAALVGGAINAFGVWREPLSQPAARVTVVNSTFVDNRVAPDPCCAAGRLPNGGAVHVEDHVTLEIRNSRFESNSAHQGGALSSYRALMEVQDSTFRGNTADVDGPSIKVGGTIFMTSSDFADLSTGGGAINRRNAELVMSHSLLQGGADNPQQGGCIFASGDVNRMDGLDPSVPQQGSPADNRALLDLTSVIFHDCDVASTGQGRGRGGALLAILSDVSAEGSLISDSDAIGGNAVGGGFDVLNRTSLRLRNTTFVRNSAGQRGGAILASGGEVQISDGFFVENDVTPGVAPGSAGEQIQNSTGAALSMSRDLALGLDITGVVQDSLFVDNVGIPIEDLDGQSPPFNLVRYDGNRFRSTAFGNLVFKNNIGSSALGGATVAQLNGLTIPRNGAPATDKSQRNNSFLNTTPSTGHLVAAPSRVLSVNAPGDPAPPTSAFLGFAWTGGSATLAGMNLADSGGIRERTTAGTPRLRVDNQNVASVTIDAGGCSDGRLMCLNRERFLLEVDWRNTEGDFGNGLVAPVGADDSGLFFFFGADNWEILAKVLNGCPITNHFWLFSAATTDLEYNLRITDTVSGLTKSFFNPLNSAAAAVTDTTALAACDASFADASFGDGGVPVDPSWAEASAALLEELDAMLESVAPSETGPGKGTTCVESDTSLCLNRERFRLEVQWRNFQGETGAGEVVPFRTNDSGLFFFFDEDNWEMLVKVLNACNTPFNSFWVFSAATTDVEYTLTVTDTETGAVKEFFNPLGVAAPAVTDTAAFLTCP